MSTPPAHWQSIHAMARRLGFDLAGVAPVDLPQRYLENLRDYIRRDHHGDMAYMARHAAEDDPVRARLPKARSVIVLAANYHRGPAPAPAPDQGRVAKYAITRDYHKVLKKRLIALATYIHGEFGAESRPYVDTGPFMEKAYADIAGLGYIGKNTCLITPEHGSWVFLSLLLTTLELPPTTREIKIQCGQCRLCIQACPTDALIPDLGMDARRCISYLTIENRNEIPEKHAVEMGREIFGCDICQQICPHNRRRPQPSAPSDDWPTLLDDGLLDLREILALRDHDDMVSRFAGTPVMRAKRRGLVRNACVAAANSGDSSLLPILRTVAAEDPDPMVRESAGIACRRLEDSTNL